MKWMWTEENENCNGYTIIDFSLMALSACFCEMHIQMCNFCVVYYFNNFYNGELLQ